MKLAEERCLALAGVFQAAFLVQQLAHVGDVKPAVLQTSLDSVLRTDANSVEAVFAGVSGLSFGLSKLADLQISRANPGTVEAMRYVLLLLVLTDHLAAEKTAVESFTKALNDLATRRQGPVDKVPPLIEDLADLYARYLSDIKPKIVVNGERHLLQEQTIIDTVRACLLAGVRAAWLWYQLGGKRWHLLFFRGRYISLAGELLAAQSTDGV